MSPLAQAVRAVQGDCEIVYLISKNVSEIINDEMNYGKNMSNFLVSAVLAIGLALSGSRTSSGWVRTETAHFSYGNIWISIKISLKFVPKVPIKNILPLVQIMAWHQLGTKPLSEPMMAYFADAYMHHCASMI